MPHVNTWIRKSNWDKWQAIENKSQWINDALESKPKELVIKPTIIKSVRSPKTCKHGNIKGECMQKEAFALGCNR